MPVTDPTLAFGFTVMGWDCDGVPLQPPVIVKTILHVPAPIAVTTPEFEFTVATFVLLLLHAPVPPPNTTLFAV